MYLIRSETLKFRSTFIQNQFTKNYNIAIHLLGVEATSLLKSILIYIKFFCRNFKKQTFLFTNNNFNIKMKQSKARFIVSFQFSLFLSIWLQKSWRVVEASRVTFSSIILFRMVYHARNYFDKYNHQKSFSNFTFFSIFSDACKIKFLFTHLCFYPNNEL